MIMNMDGITSASINVSMYLFIIRDDDSVFDDEVIEDVNLVRFWILSPKINDDVPINSKTIVKVFELWQG
ncbi:MAG: hypothetical protein WA461_07820 [Nitrososphaeraceae archaeon]